MPTILDRIVQTKLTEIAQARLATPEIELDRRIADRAPARDFTGAIAQAKAVAIIAEVKKASPSAGVIRADFDPAAIARIYKAHGAAAISVLTDRPYFQGTLADLTAVHDAVRIPVIRKEFILDHYQLLEARAAGADAVLLIAACLEGDRLATLQRAATEIGLHTLIEVHDAEELPRALDAGGKVIGINNRNLRTFTTRIEHTFDLLPRIPPDRLVVSESGIKTAADLARLHAAGVKAVLVGESLLRAPDIGKALDALREPK